MLPDGMTPEEQLRVTERAISLIATPETWVKNYWKCPVWMEDEEESSKFWKHDKHGRPLYAYCLEGAVNEAIVLELGLNRAIHLGAVKDYSASEFEYDWELDGSYADPEGDEVFWSVDGEGGGRLSINDVIRNHWDHFKGRLGLTRAQSVRDSSQPAPHLNDDLNTEHKDVLWVLETRRDQLRDQLGLPAVSS